MTTAALKIGTRHWKTEAKKAKAENERLRSVMQKAVNDLGRGDTGAMYDLQAALGGYQQKEEPGK